MVDFEIYIPSEYPVLLICFLGMSLICLKFCRTALPPVAGLKWLPPPKKVVKTGGIILK